MVTNKQTIRLLFQNYEHNIYSLEECVERMCDIILDERQEAFDKARL